MADLMLRLLTMVKKNKNQLTFFKIMVYLIKDGDFTKALM